VAHATTAQPSFNFSSKRVEAEIRDDVFHARSLPIGAIPRSRYVAMTAAMTSSTSSFVTNANGSAKRAKVSACA